jgi:hypothetical protein
MDTINNNFIELVQSDYLSFIGTFKETYSVDDYSIIWLNNLNISSSETCDLGDLFELKIFKLNSTYELRTTLKFYKNFEGNLTTGIIESDFADLKLDLYESGSKILEHTFGNISAEKITDNSRYYEDGIDGSKALFEGNSYLEHYLICDFIEEHLNYYYFQNKIKWRVIESD